jgi:hypothetical protein
MPNSGNENADLNRTVCWVVRVAIERSPQAAKDRAAALLVTEEPLLPVDRQAAPVLLVMCSLEKIASHQGG